jgi:hypothetical protein
LAKLPGLPRKAVEDLKLALKGGNPIDGMYLGDNVECEASIPFGHVKATLAAMEGLNIPYFLETSHQALKEAWPWLS